jgi:hypothetical protein
MWVKFGIMDAHKNLLKEYVFPGKPYCTGFFLALSTFIVRLDEFWFKRAVQGVFKKIPNFCYKDSILQFFSTAPFKAAPSTGDTPFQTFLPLLECFLERTFCDGAQFSCRIFLNLRVLKKIPNFLISSPTSIETALRLLSAPSGRF